MTQAAVKILEPQHANFHSALIDRAHLARITFNDQSLEREVLQLFDRQAELLVARMRGSAPPAIATLAHTLKGSATGIGASHVAHAAAAAEMAAGNETGDCARAIEQLARAVDDVRVEIAAILRAR